MVEAPDFRDRDDVAIAGWHDRTGTGASLPERLAPPDADGPSVAASDLVGSSVTIIEPCDGSIEFSDVRAGGMIDGGAR